MSTSRGRGQPKGTSERDCGLEGEGRVGMGEISEVVASQLVIA